MTFAAVERALRCARKAGFENVNLDVIFGSPDETLGEWKQTVDASSPLCAGACFDVRSGTERVERLCARKSTPAHCQGQTTIFLQICTNMRRADWKPPHTRNTRLAIGRVRGSNVAITYSIGAICPTLDWAPAHTVSRVAFVIPT